MSNITIVTALPHRKYYFVDEQSIKLLARLIITIPSLTIAFLATLLSHFVYNIVRRQV